MQTNLARGKVQEKLETLTRRWWLYPLLLLLFFIPPCASRNYDPIESLDVIFQVLSHPLVFGFPALMPIAKAIPAFLIVGVLALGNRMRCAFN